MKYAIALLFCMASAICSAGQMVKLPFNSLVAVEQDGQLMFTSEDGRFVIRGELFSVLYKKSLVSLQEIREATIKMDFKKAGIEPKKLNSFSFGQGKPVTIFIDPHCPTCIEIIPAAKSLSSQYEFTFVIVPALGEQSNQSAKKFYCAKDKAPAWNAIAEGKADTLTGASDCDNQNYDLTLLTAHMMGIRGVPYIVSPTGQFFTGAPKSLNDWLKSVE